MNSVAAVLIVKNEEKMIEDCLHSISWADDVVVVDGGSTDQTIDAARRNKARVFKRNFDNFSNQKNYAVSLAETDWIFSIDADERVSPGLRESLVEIAKKGSAFNGFYVTRENYLFGRRFLFGGQRSEKLIRFFRKGKGVFQQPIHERVRVDGPVGYLRGSLIHQSSDSVSDYLKKLSLYTDFEARWMAEKKIKTNSFDLWLKPALRFFYYYFLRGGFLDGYEGLLYHSLSSFYQTLKYSRLREIYAASKTT